MTLGGGKPGDRPEHASKRSKRLRGRGSDGRLAHFHATVTRP